MAIPRSTSEGITNATPVEHIDAAAESIRALIHATLGGDGYVWPSDVDAVLSAMQLLADQLPQALRQAGTWLVEQHAAGRVGHDTRGKKARRRTSPSRRCSAA